ncbi:MAG: HEAT repeat domain-containing protein [Gemmataceae bacterium]
MLGWFRGLWQKFTQGGLRRRLNSRDAAVRLAALKQFREKPNLQEAPSVLLLLADAHGPIRDDARAALHQIGGEAVPVLLTGLKSPSDDVTVPSAELLGEFGGVTAVDPLLTALKFTTRPTQLAAKRALQRLGHLALPGLKASAQEPQPWVRQQIAEVIAAIEVASPSRGG